jgi:hypothetical protein
MTCPLPSYSPKFRTLCDTFTVKSQNHYDACEYHWEIMSMLLKVFSTKMAGARLIP